jgi:hypothetical protein
MDFNLQSLIEECFPNNAEIILFMEKISKELSVEGALFLYEPSFSKTVFKISSKERLTFQLIVSDSDDFLSFSFGEGEYNMDISYLEFIEDLKDLKLLQIIPFLESNVKFQRTYKKNNMATDEYTFLRQGEVFWSRKGASFSSTLSESGQIIYLEFKPWL